MNEMRKKKNFVEIWSKIIDEMDLKLPTKEEIERQMLVSSLNNIIDYCLEKKNCDNCPFKSFCLDIFTVHPSKFREVVKSSGKA